MQYIPRSKRALRVIGADIRAEGHERALLVVLADWVPVAGIRRGGAGRGDAVADLAGLGVGGLPDVFALVLGCVKLHGSILVNPAAVLFVPPLAASLRFVLFQVDLVLAITKPPEQVRKAPHELPGGLPPLLLLNGPLNGL